MFTLPAGGEEELLLSGCPFARNLPSIFIPLSDCTVSALDPSQRAEKPSDCTFSEWAPSSLSLVWHALRAVSRGLLEHSCSMVYTWAMR